METLLRLSFLSSVWMTTTTNAYQWLPLENGTTFPPTAYYDAHGVKDYFFCRVFDGAVSEYLYGETLNFNPCSEQMARHGRQPRAPL
jgi:hypothetical protein